MLIAVEAGWRAWRRSPPGDIAHRLETILLVMLVIAIAGGLGLLVGGARPQELLHFVYAIVVLSARPGRRRWCTRGAGGGRSPVRDRLASQAACCSSIRVSTNPDATGVRAGTMWSLCPTVRSNHRIDLSGVTFR